MPTTKRHKEYADDDDDDDDAEPGTDGRPDSSQARKLSNSTEHCVHNKADVDLDEGCWLRLRASPEDSKPGSSRRTGRIEAFRSTARIQDFRCGPSRGRHQHRVSVGSLGWGGSAGQSSSFAGEHEAFAPEPKIFNSKPWGTGAALCRLPQALGCFGPTQQVSMTVFRLQGC